MRSKEEVQKLIEIATAQLSYAYAPYSRFRVGAALLAEDGRIFTGCNIENASYGATNCAERTAFFKAVSEGARGFRAICIVGGPEGKPAGYAPPCGVCRQVMMEFCDPERFAIILAAGMDDYQIYTLKELLPLGFGPGSLGGENSAGLQGERAAGPRAEQYASGLPEQKGRNHGEIS